MKVEFLNMEKVSKSLKIMVVVIDFGIIFFGFVFFLKSDWGKVLINIWFGGFLILYKVLICLFLKKDYKEYFFGYEVEDKYLDLILDDNYSDYYFF